jgi:hypothetical protein
MSNVPNYNWRVAIHNRTAQAPIRIASRIKSAGFRLLYKSPQIKAMFYINWDWVFWSKKIGFQWEDWKDARIEKNEIVAKAYYRN